MKTEETSEEIVHLNLMRHYSSNAKTYDYAMRLFNDEFSRKLLFSKLNMGILGKVMECGAGTGKNVRYYPLSADVHLVEPNREMLEIARKKVKDWGLSGFSFHNQDGRKLEFVDNWFDECVLSYVLSGSASNSQLLSEAIRVLKVGGRIGILDFDQQPRHTIGGFGGLNLDQLVNETRDLRVDAWVQIPKMPPYTMSSQSVYVLTKER